MSELEKHMHIIIENAVQEGTTLEDLKLITEEENPKISYPDFEELRFAIETLGGEYTKQRDFSSDKYYKKLKG